MHETPDQAPQPQIRPLGPHEIESAIKKIQTRIAAIRAFDPSKMGSDAADARASALAEDVKDALLEIFGANDRRYLRHRDFEIWRYNHQIVPPAAHQVLEAIEDGIPVAIETLESIIRALEEARGDIQGSQARSAAEVFGSLNLHPAIRSAVIEHFKVGQYRSAVLDAALALEQLVVERSGVSGDGADLVRRVFSPKKPLLSFAAGKAESAASLQEGMMHFFEGVALAFRNPRAHGLDEDTAEDAGFDRHNQPAGEESRQGNAPRALSYGTDLPGTRGWFPSPTRTAMPSARLSSNGE